MYGHSDLQDEYVNGISGGRKWDRYFRVRVCMQVASGRSTYLSGIMPGGTSVELAACSQVHFCMQQNNFQR